MNHRQVQEHPIAEQPVRVKSTGSKMTAWLSENMRLVVQIAFSLLVIWIGIEFYSFVNYLESGGVAGSAHRPPGVEGFLPISSLMNLYYFALTGNIHAAHPAGLFILMGVIVVLREIGRIK